MSVRYFYVATLTFALGILGRSFLSVEFPLLLLLLGVVFICGVTWQWWFQEKVWVVVSICFVFLMLGVLRMEYSWSQVGVSPLVSRVGEKVEIEGVVVREPEQHERTLQLYIQTEGGLILVFADRYESVRYGDVVQVKGTLKEPETFVTDLGRSFNYPGYLLARGVEYTISFPQMVVIDSGKGNVLIAQLLIVKGLFVSALSTVLPEPELGLGVGLLLGVKQGLGEDLEAAFRTTGIIHIVVLSGYNILLVVTFVTFLLSFVFSPRPRLVFGILSIIGFAFLVGLSATVVRACIMAALCLLAQTYGRSYEVLRGLLFAGVVMLCINPFLLVYDVGFQLSFLATLGLILAAPHLGTFFSGVPLQGTFKEFLVATVATQITVLPFLLYQIGQFSVVALIVNMLVLPMVPIAMLLTFMTGVFALMSPLASTLLIYPTYLSLTYIISLADFFSTIPYASLTVPVFPLLVVPFAYLLLGYWWYRAVSKTTEVTVVSMADWIVIDEDDEEKQGAA